MARVYNGWSWYVRLAHPKTRLEAITSRPKRLSAVGRMTSHAGQQKILLTITHEAAAPIKRLVVNVRAGLSPVRETAPQLDKPQRWFALGSATSSSEYWPVSPSQTSGWPSWRRAN